MKNIAIYYESSQATGGVNRVASVLASALADRGYRIHIISRYEGEYSRFSDDKRIKYHKLFKKFHSKYITFFVEIIKLRKIVRDENIDVLISAGGIFFALAQFSRTRHVEWDHVSFWHGNYIQHFFRRLSVRNADAVVTLTQDNQRAFLSVKGVNARVVTIHNPAICKSVNQVDTSNRTIISLGFLAPQKGYDLLLKAWSKIDESLRCEWRLLIAGEDEGDKPILDKIIRDKHLCNVELLGFRTDVSDLLSQSSIYVMSSRWEGMPMVLLEAQSYGLPIVSFDCKTGPSEILTPQCGVLVEAENIYKLAKALEAVMVDEGLREQLSMGAIENIKRFDLDKIVNQWVDLIESL